MPAEEYLVNPDLIRGVLFVTLAWFSVFDSMNRVIMRFYQPIIFKMTRITEL